MTNESMEKRLADALEKTAPDDLDGVLSRCEKRKGTESPMTIRKTRKVSKIWTSVMAACLALVMISGGVLYQQSNAVASVVSLDVNPSIELKVSKSEKILACSPLNEDAKVVLADMGSGADLKGAKLDVAVNAIVGALVRHGYLEDISSAIMISVEDKNQERAEKLRRELTDTVDGILQTSSSKAAVLTQTLRQDNELERQAKQSNISTGKAALVNRIVEMNGKLSFSELAALSVGELKDLAEIGAPGMPIGKIKAKEIADAELAKLTKTAVLGVSTDSELDHIPAHYEVEFEMQDGEEIEFIIDAFSGAVLEVKRESEKENHAQQPANPAAPVVPAAPVTIIGHIEAKFVALTHAGLSEQQVYDMDIELDDEGGRMVYDVEFKSGKTEYDYVIDAVNAAILESKQEPAEEKAPVQPQTPASSDIGQAKAKSVALTHAGLTESQVYELEVESDYENGKSVYDVEFKSGSYEYDYTVDAATGAILKHETELDD